MTAAERAPMAAAQPGTPVLEVRDLRTAFRTRDGWLPIVKGISFDIGAAPDAGGRRRVRARARA